MTLPTAVRNFIRKMYGDGCIFKGGFRNFQRLVAEHTPQVCIEDAMLRIHCVSYKMMREYAKFRLAKMNELGCFDDTGVRNSLREDGIILESNEPMWFDVFLWIMAAVQRFYGLHDNSKVYVMLFDRGTPPAKYLKYIERYSTKTKKIPPEHLLDTSKKLDDAFEKSPFIPPYVFQWMKQKGFVDLLIRKIACHFIPKYYHPPEGKMFILDGPSKNRFPILWNGQERMTLKSPIYRNHCLESDLSIIFWCNVFKNRDIRVVTADGDVLLGLLLYSRYRISRISESSVCPGKMYSFTFLNSIYLEHASKTIPEIYDEEITDEYYKMCHEESPNELNGRSSESKKLFLETLDRRYAAQKELLTLLETESASVQTRLDEEQIRSEFVDTILSSEPKTWKEKIGKEAVQKSMDAYERFVNSAQSNNPSEKSGFKRKTPSQKSSKEKRDETELNNVEMTKQYDIYYGSDGIKIFKWYEVVSINHLYQNIYDDLMTRYDRRLSPATGDNFLPIESFVLACKICGDDYIKKPQGIGENFILRSFYECLNSNGNLVYGKKVDSNVFANYDLKAKPAPEAILVPKISVSSSTKKPPGKELSSCTGSSSANSEDDRVSKKEPKNRDTQLRKQLMSDYDHYLQIVIDFDAVVQLIRNAFILKGKKTPYQTKHEVWVMCGNLRYSMNYFANDFKTSVTFTDCFDIHAKPDGCGKSVYGYELIDKNDYPSQTNIRRPKEVCDCFVKNIRKYIEEKTKRLTNSQIQY